MRNERERRKAMKQIKSGNMGHMKRKRKNGRLR